MSTSPSAQYPRLATGAAAQAQNEASYGGPLSMFHPHVEYVIPGAKIQGLVCRILPAFNPAAFGTPEYQMSYIPYRDPSTVNPETNLEVFTGWFSYLRVFRYLGNQNLSFVSPSSLPEGLPDAVRACPMAQIRNYCSGEPSLKYLTEEPDKNDPQQHQQSGQGKTYKSALIPRAKAMAVMNVIKSSTNDRTAKNALLLLTDGGFQAATDQMDYPMPAYERQGQPVNPGYIDPNWPRYMLGDVTDPHRGLVGWIQQMSIGNTMARPWCLQFVQSNQNFAGHSPYPIGPEALMGRYDFADMNKVVRIEPYQKIVDVLVADGFISSEIIARACGHMANVTVSQQPTYAAAVTGFPGAPQSNMPPQGGMGQMPQMGSGMMPQGMPQHTMPMHGQTGMGGMMPPQGGMGQMPPQMGGGMMPQHTQPQMGGMMPPQGGMSQPPQMAPLQQPQSGMMGGMMPPQQGMPQQQPQMGGMPPQMGGAPMGQMPPQMGGMSQMPGMAQVPQYQMPPGMGGGATHPMQMGQTPPQQPMQQMPPGMGGGTPPSMGAPQMPATYQPPVMGGAPQYGQPPGMGQMPQQQMPQQQMPQQQMPQQQMPQQQMPQQQMPQQQMPQQTQPGVPTAQEASFGTHQPPADSGQLTPAEFEDLQKLSQMALVDITSMAPPDITRLGALNERYKQSGAQQA